METSDDELKKAENVAEEIKTKKTRKSKKTGKKSQGEGGLDKKSLETLAAEASDDGQDAVDMDDTDEGLDEQVKKLIDYAKNKLLISWDEINEILSPEFVNSPKMDEVLQILPKYNIQIIDESDSLLDEEDEEAEEELEDEEAIAGDDVALEPKADDPGKKRFVEGSDKDSIDEEIFRRHPRCRCTLTVKRGKMYQDAWSKAEWSEDKANARAEAIQQKQAEIQAEEARRESARQKRLSDLEYLMTKTGYSAKSASIKLNQYKDEVADWGVDWLVDKLRMENPLIG